MPDPWERREDETPTRYFAFSCYRDLGPGRTLQAAWDVYRMERGNKGDSPSSTFRDWSANHDWVDRAAAYDDYVSRQIREALEQERIRDKRRRVELLQAYREQIAEAMTSLNPGDLDFKEATKALKAVTQELRKEFDDEPTQRVEEETRQVTTFELPDNGRADDE